MTKSDLADNFRIYQTPNAGVLLRTQNNDSDIEPERDLCAYLILRGIQSAGNIVTTGSHPEEVASIITSIFEDQLLFDAHDKKGWSTGCAMFTEHINFYTSRDLPVEFALPAFPCKTTNQDKVASTLPDGAEYEALANLQAFCDRVQQVYSPGCYINIVSDGHVFSDCQGTDDDVVHAYNLHLKLMLTKICAKSTTGSSSSTTSGIRFYDLGQLLQPDGLARCLAERVPKANKVRHPVQTRISGSDDDNRALMLGLFAPPEPYYRDLVKCQPDHPITALYRGFSRFMYEDLVLGSSPVSKSQRKKAAEEVAFTMIQRNQTYSRMVESVMPRHVRLSIHAHDNAGPKFAVRVMPWAIKHAENTDVLVNAGNMTQEDASYGSWDAKGTGHIPTPWHNTLVEVHTSGGRQVFLCRQSVIREALQRGMEGEYVEHERGARYVIRKA